MGIIVAMRVFYLKTKVTIYNCIVKNTLECNKYWEYCHKEGENNDRRNTRI